MPLGKGFGTVRRLPSGRWQARYHDPVSGERVVGPAPFRTKTDAQIWLTEQHTSLLRGELSDPRLARRPFKEWAEEWLAGIHVKPKTRVAYESSLRNHVMPAFGNRPVNTITYRDCKDFVNKMLAAGYAPGTVGEARKILRLVLQEALRSEAIHRNPAERLKVPVGKREEMIFLDIDQVVALAHSIENPPRPRSHPLRTYPQYGLLIRLASLTGLRAGELGALRVGRVGLAECRLEVAESAEEIHGALTYGAPKTYAVRSVPIPSALRDELAEHLARRVANLDDFVFTSPTGEALRHTNFYRRHYKPALARAGLDPATRFHDLRHTAAALMIAEGANLLSVKQRLGHSTIQVTADRYGHLFPALEAELTERLGGSYSEALKRLR